MIHVKKWAALILAAMLAFSQIPALAEQTVDNHLTVGHTTAFSGNFATQMWGNNSADLDVLHMLFGYNLVQWDYDQGVFLVDPAVVTGIAVYDDEQGNRTYTLALAEDLCYNNGTPITAWDYAFSVLLAAAPEAARLGGDTEVYNALLGMDAYQSGEADVLAGLRVDGDYMISFTVAAEYRPFFYELGMLRCFALPIGEIAPGCTVKDDGNGVYIDQSQGEFTAEVLQTTLLDADNGYLTHPDVTSGPYQLVSYDGASVEFAINPLYKGNALGQKPSIETVTFKTVTNADMMQQLESGEVDLLNKVVAADNIDQGVALMGTGLFSMSSYARIGYSFMSFNCEQPTVSTPAVRQAIAYCLDKDALVAGYVGNYGLRVDGYYGIGQWMYQLVNGTIEPNVEEPEANASAEEKAAYEEELLAWEEISMENIPVYNLDLSAAEKLLDDNGWNLNTAGEPFRKGQDDVRCAMVGDTLIPLDLELIYPEGNAIADDLQTCFVDNLSQVGIRLTVTPVPMHELLKQYYRLDERQSDMIYLATNFDVVFDPTNAYAIVDGKPIASNYSGIVDEQLFALASDLTMTEPGDVLTYCQKWLTFQEYWATVLPAIPIYSNAYFDFYTYMLQDYEINASATWSQAIVPAYLGEPEVEEEEELGEGEVIFDE